MKSTILLTIAIFLVSAPAPDPSSISEISGGFLFAPNADALRADALRAAENKAGPVIAAAGENPAGTTESAAADEGKTTRKKTRPARRD